jgi:hypothetical protein
MNKITHAELIKYLNSSNAAKIISLDIETEPNMRKTNNPYKDGCTKTSSLTGIVHFNYENSVNRQLEREGKDFLTFTAQERKWGTLNGAWVEHKGKYYLQVKVEKASDSVYKYKGEEIPIEKIESFLYESSKPNTQFAIDKEVVVRDIKIENIKRIRMDKEEFEVVEV